MQGPIWYRAAKYGTQQEASNASSKLKADVANLRGENILTIMFSNPEGSYFVAALGYPSPAARAQVEKLIPHPVALTDEEIKFMRAAVANYRRGRGVSDREATAWAEKRLDAAGLPEEIKKDVLRDYSRAPELQSEESLREYLRENLTVGGFHDETDEPIIELPANARPEMGEVEREVRRRLTAGEYRGLSEREIADRLLAAREVDEQASVAYAQGEEFAGQLAGELPAMPGLQPGAPLKMQRIPFLIGYRDLQARGIETTADKYGVPRGEGTNVLQETMNAIIWRKLKRAEKYQFDNSALAMLNTVRDSAASAWLPLETPLWIEFAQALQTAHGEDIRALWVHTMDLQNDIREVAPPGRDLQVYKLMMERNALYRGYWSFNVIDIRAREIFDFTYDVARGRYVYLYSHVCPYGKCNYTVPETRYSLGECSPCLECRAALAYWASVLHTAIRMIRREYALAPEEPRPWAARPEGYSETVKVKVGKGKNARHVREEKRREVAYRLVSYEVSEIAPAAIAQGEEIVAHEESEGSAQGKRPNWLTLAQANAIIWEYRAIDTSKGRTLDPERNPRWKVKQHIEIAPFKKWVPMLAPGERKTIKRVTARRYAAQDKGE